MPRIVATLPDPPDPEAVAALPTCDEVLLEHRELSRRGRLDDQTLSDVAARLGDRRAVLVWDVLMDDAGIVRGQAVLDRCDLDRFDAIRVQDVGVACHLRERYPDLPLQLVVETGNHNLVGLRAWTTYLAPERLIVSNEIPVRELGAMRRQLSVPVEIQVLGRILIYYTPRALMPEGEIVDTLERLAVSEEDGRRFPIVQNRHGTFMYYEKELFLLPYLPDIAAEGIDAVRLDFSSYPPETVHRAAAFLREPGPEQRQALEACLGSRLTRGFFKSNRTDKQFERLKNPSLGLREDLTPLGVVVGTRKKRFTAILAQHPFALGDRLCFAIPEGDLIEATVTRLSRPAEGEAVTSAEPGLWLINHCKKVSAGSRVYVLSD